MERWEIFNHRRWGFQDILEDDESVEEVFRQEIHLCFLKMLFWGILWGGISAGIWFLFRSQLWFVWGATSIFGIYKMFRVFLNWYMNAILMTTNNLVFVDWEGPFRKRSTRMDYWNLDEVQVVRIGIRSFLANYGDLFFMKYNGGVLYEAKRIARPNYVARRIEKYRESQVDAKNFTEESALKELISSMVQGHVRDHGQPEREKEKGKGEKEKEKKPFLSKIFKPDKVAIEVEKEMDDDGGIEIDLND